MDPEISAPSAAGDLDGDGLQKSSPSRTGIRLLTRIFGEGLTRAGCTFSA
jgi:hypothetical protein